MYLALSYSWVLFLGVFTVFSGAAFVPVSNAVFKLGLPGGGIARLYCYFGRWGV